MVTVSFEFKTILDAREFLDRVDGPATVVWNGPHGEVPKPGEVVWNGVHEISKVDEAPAILTEPKKRGPKPKTKPDYKVLPQEVSGTRLIADAIKDPVIEKIEKPGALTTIEDCRTALSDLFSAKGRDAAKDVLARFKNADGFPLKAVSELQVTDYGKFIAACKAAT